MKKIILCLSLLSCLLGLLNTSFANCNISAISNKEYSIIYNDETKSFYNANGVPVYPILYEGTNYLPIRAVSSLFNVAIEWNGEKKVIYLGTGEIDNRASKTITNFKNEKNQNIDAIVNEEINIMYNGKILQFYKTISDRRERIFPISFEGTTYLPVRNITELFAGTIEWDGTNKIIKIDSKEYLEQKNVTDKNPYYVGDEYTYCNGDLYYRMYEPVDYKTDYTGHIYHEYNTISGERNIARIKNSVGATNVEILFKNDSRGSFYFIDNKFFFSNDNEIYASNINGVKLLSYGKGTMKRLDIDNHKLEIYKEDGIYEINTQSLNENKKTNLYYDYTLEKIKNEYFDKDLSKKNFRELYKDAEKCYYYFINNENIYIYSFNYLTKENKLIVSTSKEVIEEDYGYSDDQIGIEFLGEYIGKKYVYINVTEVGIGTSTGRICCIDEFGNENVLINILYNFVNYDVNGNQLYIYTGDATGDSKNYLIRMDTMNISNLEGCFEAEDKESLLADKLMNIHLNTELKENLKSYFKIEDLRRQLNDIYNSAKNSNENIWDETSIELTHRYKCGYMYVYEYSVVAHGYLSWRGDYSRAGVVYFLVDTARHNVHEIYRVSL